MALEERLELDVADALRGIDTIEAALTAAAQSFKVALGEALDLLSTVAIEEVDASAVTTGIDEAVQAADLSPTVEADASGVTGAIDEAVAAVDGQVVVDADASAVPDEITAAVDAADTSVTIDAITDQITAQIESAVADSSAEVDVSANTAEAEAQIGQLGEVAQDTGAKLSGAGQGAEAFGALSAASAGSVGGLTSQLGKLGAIGGVAAAGVTGVGLAVGELFQQALAADTADRRFAASLGEIADRVDAIRIDGFADDLATLAENAGSSDEAMKLAAARIADLGNSSGAAQDQIAETAENILLLATRATVLNPTLGDAGQVADQLTNALARGGRPLRQFGIDLATADIQARAVADAGGDAAAATDGFSLSAAGAAIVAERLGTRLRDDIVEGAKGTEIQLRSLREQFGNTLETFGKPLLEPVLAAIREGQPILLDLAETFGQLGGALLPVAIDALRTFAPILSSVADVVQLLLQVLSPVLAVIDAIPDPLLQAVATFLLLQRGIGALLGVVGLVAPALAASLGPLGLLVAGVAAAVTIFSAFGDGQKDAKADVDALTQSFADQAEAIDADVQAAASKRIADKNQTDDLRDLGLSVREFSDLTSQGASGFIAFIDTLERGGQVTPALADALRKTGGDVDAVKDAFARALAGGQGLAQSNTGLIESFVSLSSAAQDAAQAQLDALVVQEQITNAQADQAVALTRNADGTKNYVAALASLGVTGDATAEKIDGLSVALSDLVPASAIGDTEELTGALADFQSALDDQTQAAEDATAAQNDLVDAHIAALDSTVSNEQAHRDYGDALDEVNRSGAARFKAGLEAEAEAAKAAQDALNGLLDAQIGFLDSSIGAEEAARRLGDALQTASQQSNLILSPDASQTEEAEKAQAEFAGTIRDVRDAALAAAKADLRLAEDRAKANGGTLTAIQRQEAFAASLRRSAEQAAGPAQDAILALVNTYESLPKNIETKVTADTTKAQAAQKDYADSILGAREAAIQTAEADLALADARADAADRILTPVERQNIFAASLQATADKANGPVRDAILNTIDLYNRIPTGLRTEFDANTKPATDKVGTLSALIKSDVLTVATKPIDANIEPAKAKVAELSKLIKTDLATLLVFASAAGKVPGAAAGGTFSGPGIFQVGEQGREIITLTSGQVANVIPNQATEAVLSGRGNVALDPELSAAIRDLAGRPRVEATILASAPTASATYETAMETARQLDSLAARLAAAE